MAWDFSTPSEVFGCQAPDSGNAELIAAGANEDQRERWLYPLLRGELRSTFSLTEFDNSGSDPTGARPWTNSANWFPG
ncbi:MAG: hypothetical protein OXC05_11090 [Halieaceae bacterium]|nr:hypothetical protein [Halieaceae bacterium]